MGDPHQRLATALADRYTIERELGQGGMATVYLAEDIKHKRKVAVKVLRPELAAVLGADRFVREIETTANLQHPHILPLFDSGEADGFLFYVMPYVEGESLRDRLSREGRLSLDEALAIVGDVAAALTVAHDKGIIHRDIKPENILVKDGEGLVADFGIALALSRVGGDQLTATGLAVGTPAYMSPEQIGGERTIDGRSDVYALGCVLFELLTGEPPFTGPTAQAVVAQTMTEPPRAASTRATGQDRCRNHAGAGQAARKQVRHAASVHQRLHAISRVTPTSTPGTGGRRIGHRRRGGSCTPALAQRTDCTGAGTTPRNRGPCGPGRL
jgi:serine/threonine-protein kinase